jgi:hypothetical protein
VGVDGPSPRPLMLWAILHPCFRAGLSHVRLGTSLKLSSGPRALRRKSREPRPCRAFDLPIAWHFARAPARLATGSIKVAPQPVLYAPPVTQHERSIFGAARKCNQLILPRASVRTSRRLHGDGRAGDPGGFSSRCMIPAVPSGDGAPATGGTACPAKTPGGMPVPSVEGARAKTSGGMRPSVEGARATIAGGMTLPSAEGAPVVMAAAAASTGGSATGPPVAVTAGGAIMPIGGGVMVPSVEGAPMLTAGGATVSTGGSWIVPSVGFWPVATAGGATVAKGGG